MTATLHGTSTTPSSSPRLESLLGLVVRRQGSDLHLQTGSSPRIRIDGRLEKVAGETTLSSDELTDFAACMLRTDQFESLLRGDEVDVSYQTEVGRFRVHVYRQAGGVAMTRACTVEIEGKDRPALVAEWVGVVYG